MPGQPAVHRVPAFGLCEPSTPEPDFAHLVKSLRWSLRDHVPATSIHAPTHRYSFAPRIKLLSEWVRPESFRPVPDDWAIFLTDVERSTEAISRGQYKTVNALDATCIVAATNAAARTQSPLPLAAMARL